MWQRPARPLLLPPAVPGLPLLLPLSAPQPLLYPLSPPPPPEAARDESGRLLLPPGAATAAIMALLLPPARPAEPSRTRSDWDDDATAVLDEALLGGVVAATACWVRESMWSSAQPSRP